MTNCDCYDLEP